LIEDTFDVKKNSLNFLRLFFALVVLFSHAESIGQFGTFGIIFGKSAIDTLAVYGFFCISGFLLARSADRRSIGNYLWSRFLRIFPGFWTCLVLTAFLFALIGWYSFPHHLVPATLNGFARQPNGPFQYVFNNFFLEMVQPRIGTIIWNGSLWTLFYEFLCYMVLALMSLCGILKSKFLVAVVTAMIWIFLVLCTSIPHLNSMFNVFHFWVLMNFLVFTSIFLLGALVYQCRSTLPDSKWIALASLSLFVASFWLPIGVAGGPYRLSSVAAMSPLLVYPVIWLGIHLPLTSVASKNDYSYGIYIYAYPVERLLAVWHFNKFGYVIFSFVSLCGALLFAVLSWWLLEKKALGLKSMPDQIPRIRASENNNSDSTTQEMQQVCNQQNG